MSSAWGGLVAQAAGSFSGGGSSGGSGSGSSGYGGSEGDTMQTADARSTNNIGGISFADPNASKNTLILVGAGAAVLLVIVALLVRR